MDTIFFSFAHPDDESFTVGGLIAKLANESGIETVVYSATLGDAGKCGLPPVCSKEDLAKFREQELQQACEHLGVDHVVSGTFNDGQLHTIQPEVLKEEVKKQLEQFKPKVVITFPPHGISGHKDHTAIQEATLAAVKETNVVERLYYVVLPESLTTGDGDGPPYGNRDEEIDVKIPIAQPELEQVRKALLAHKTQHLSIDRVFPTIYSDSFTKHNNVEHFICAFKRKDRGEHDIL
jgi:N-acetylglucosamine malate deacetylase 2